MRLYDWDPRSNCSLILKRALAIWRKYSDGPIRFLWRFEKNYFMLPSGEGKVIILIYFQSSVFLASEKLFYQSLTDWGFTRVCPTWRREIPNSNPWHWGKEIPNWDTLKKIIIIRPNYGTIDHVPCPTPTTISIGLLLYNNTASIL